MVRVGVRIISWYIGVILRNILTVRHRVLLNPYTTVGHQDTAFIYTLLSPANGYKFCLCQSSEEFQVLPPRYSNVQTSI